jgi:predicted nuclease of restriction endonuclease-like (RecB) superfamily
MTITIEHTSYKDLIEILKNEIAAARVKAHLAVNKELIILYWNIGNNILKR